jgi:hypothetical protein
MKMDAPKAITAVHEFLEITYHSNEKVKEVVSCFEKQFISHDLCDENRERRV